MKGYKSYKFEVGQAVMKANPKKLGGRKGDRMTPDWLSGYVVEKLTDQQVVLHNTKTDKVLKSISLVHFKPFRERGVGKSDDDEVGSVGDDLAGVGDEVAGDVTGVGDKVVGDKVACVVDKVVGDKVACVGDKVVGDKVACVGDKVAGGDVACVGDKVVCVGDKVAGGDVACVGHKVVGHKVAGGDVAGVCDEVAGVCEEVAGAKFADQLEYLRLLLIAGVPLCDNYLYVGPARVTRRDIWSLIPPQEIPTWELRSLQSEVPDFMPGWLSDMVS